MDKNFKKITTWAQNQGFKVKIGNFDDSIDLEKSTIFINQKQSNKEKIFSLAHECGHILLYKSKIYENHLTMLNDDLFGENINTKSNQYKVEKIIEEFFAWERGKALLFRLNVKFKSHEYDKEKHKYVAKYMKYYSKFVI